MWIRRLIIQNYHHYQHNELQFNAGLNIITAPNEHGKSTSLNALQMALTGQLVAAEQLDSRISLHIDYTEPEHGITYALNRVGKKLNGQLFCDSVLVNETMDTYAHANCDDNALLSQSNYIMHQTISVPEYGAFDLHWQQLLMRMLMPSELAHIDQLIDQLKRSIKQLYTKHKHSKSEIAKLDQQLSLHYRERTTVKDSMRQQQELVLEFNMVKHELKTLKNTLNTAYEKRNKLIETLPYAEKFEQLDKLNNIIVYENLDAKADDKEFLDKQSISDDMVVLSQKMIEAETTKQENKVEFKQLVVKKTLVSAIVALIFSLIVAFNFKSVPLFIASGVALFVFSLVILLWRAQQAHQVNLNDISNHTMQLDKRQQELQEQMALVNQTLISKYQSTMQDQITNQIINAKRHIREYHHLKKMLKNIAPPEIDASQIQLFLESNHKDIIELERNLNDKQLRLDKVNKLLNQQPKFTLIDIEHKIEQLERKRQLKHEQLVMTKTVLNVYEHIKRTYSAGENPEILSKLNQTLTHLSDHQMYRVVLSDNGNLHVNNQFGERLTVDKLSTGAFNLILFAQKLAILDYYDPGGRLPLLIDDAFISLDSKRKHNVHNYLSTLAQRRQIIYATTDFAENFQTINNINKIIL